MRRQILIRSLIVVGVVCAFGVLDAIVKGHHGGVRNAIGNVSAPWAMIPFLAAAIAVPRRLALGAVIGATSIVAALGSYALARGPSSHSLQTARASMAATLPLENRWLLLGLAGGVTLGVAGSWFAGRRSWGTMTVVVAGLLVLEPVARVLRAVSRGDTVGTFVPSSLVWSVEVFFGCTCLVAYRLRNPGAGRCRQST